MMYYCQLILYSQKGNAIVHMALILNQTKRLSNHFPAPLVFRKVKPIQFDQQYFYEGLTLHNFHRTYFLLQSWQKYLLK